MRRLAITFLLAVVIVVAHQQPAAADNCGGLTDCSSGVRIGLAILGIVLLAAVAFFAWEFLAAAAIEEEIAAVAAEEAVTIAEEAATTAAEEAATTAAEEAAAAAAEEAATASAEETAATASAEETSAAATEDAVASTERSLGVDPKTGQFRQSEFDTAVRVQNERNVTLARSTHEGADWIDVGTNETYDAVGNFSSEFFDEQWPNLQRRILDHLAKADRVPVDVSQFTQSQIDTVRSFVQDLGPRVFLVGE